MIISGWLLSKCDQVEDGIRPIVASMSLEWHAPMQPLKPDGWVLVQVKCDIAHYNFIRQDEDFIWIGNEWSKVPRELLDAYADKLDQSEQYQTFGQVLDELEKWDFRFSMRLTPK